MNILVTGAGGPAGINTLAFLPSDVKVFACDTDPQTVEKIRKAGLEPPALFRIPRAREEGFLETVKKIIHENMIDVLIPTVDEELMVFSENPIEQVVVSPQKTITVCNDKYLLYEEFRSYPFCPIYTLGKSDVAIYGQVFVKPRIGRGSRNTASYQTEREIPAEFLTDDFVICEYLPGKEYTVDAMCDLEGNLVYAVPRIRTDVMKGVSVKGITEKNQEILKITGEICKVLKFVGPINLQFKLDVNSKPKLVEINPRFSGGLPITVASGIEPLKVLLNIIQGKNLDKDMLEWNEIESENDIMRRVRL